LPILISAKWQLFWVCHFAVYKPIVFGPVLEGKKAKCSLNDENIE